MTIFTPLFWKDARERMLATAAQVMLTIITVYLPAISLANSGDLQAGILFMVHTAPFIALAGLGGAFYALLKAIVAARVAGTDTASFAVDTKPLK